MFKKCIQLYSNCFRTEVRINKVQYKQLLPGEKPNSCIFKLLFIPEDENVNSENPILVLSKSPLLSFQIHF